MVATPAVSAPSEAKVGTEVSLSGSGFRAGTEVKIVLGTPYKLDLGSVRARSDGTFKAAIVVPPQASPGKHKLQVVGMGSSGRPMSFATQLVVLTAATAAITAPSPRPGLAQPVLLTIAAVLPLATWLVLEIVGWRGRRLGRRAVNSG